MKMNPVTQAICLIFLSPPVLAQEAEATQQIERVLVTGSSIKRMAQEGALPVTTLGRADIERSGAVSTEDLLKSITATSSVGGSNSGQAVSSGGKSSMGLASVSLRGLGANRTLVLLNGRRLAAYAVDGSAVDVNAIPVSSLERVEVLKDGASSIYGSDAVGGVVNFIQRQDYQGLEVNAYAGNPTRSGGGASQKAGLLAGWGQLAQDRFNLQLSLDLEQASGIRGSERDFARQPFDFANPNAPRFDNGNAPSGDLQPWVLGQALNKQPGSVIGNINAKRGTASGNACEQAGNYYDPIYRTCKYGTAAIVSLRPEIKRLNLGLNFKQKLGQQDEWFAEGFVSHSSNRRYAGAVPVTTSQLSSASSLNRPENVGLEQAIILKPGSTFYPSAWLQANAPAYLGQPMAVSYRAVDAGDRLVEDKASAYRAVLGIRGLLPALNDWDYELAASVARSQVQEDALQGYLLYSQLLKSMNDCQCLNPAVARQSTSTTTLIQTAAYQGWAVRSALKSSTLEGKTSGTLLALPAGAVDAALGFSLRRNQLDYDSSAQVQSGDVAGYGGSYAPYARSRKEASVYGELNASLIKGLEANLALRSDHLEGVGNTTNPKLSLRWLPRKELLLRASAGTGFRAPTLVELYSPHVLSITPTFSDPLNPGLGKQQWVQTSGGNPNLKPETSRQSSVGLVFAPSGELSIGLDYYQIRIQDTISSLSAAGIVAQAAAGEAFWLPYVQRNPANNHIVNINSTAQNIGSVFTSGLDLDVSWSRRFEGLGLLSANLSGNYVRSYDLTRADGVVEPSVGRMLNDKGSLNSALTGGGVITRWHHQATVALSHGNWVGSLTHNFQSSYDTPTFYQLSIGQASGKVPENSRVDSVVTLDAQLAYKGFKNLKLTLGVKNLLDSNPPVIMHPTQLYFQAGYDMSYYDARARFVYLGASYQFR